MKEFYYKYIYKLLYNYHIWNNFKFLTYFSHKASTLLYSINMKILKINFQRFVEQLIVQMDSDSWKQFSLKASN